MRDHDYLMSRNHDYREAHHGKAAAINRLSEYRSKYLGLRAEMREFFRANPEALVKLTDEQRKAIGLKLRGG